MAFVSFKHLKLIQEKTHTEKSYLCSNTVVLQKLTVCCGVSYFGSKMSVKLLTTSNRARVLDFKIKCCVIVMLS